MKIRNDFITNSSSTSFIFGTPNSYTETVDTIFNFIRMISNEILFIYDSILMSINEDKYIKLIGLSKRNINDYTLYDRVNKLIKYHSFKTFYRKLLSESFLVSESEDGGLYDFVYIFQDKATINQYKKILNYNSYGNYINDLGYNIELYIYDIEQLDEVFCSKRLRSIVLSYYYKQCEDDNIDYDLIQDKIDNTNIKFFVLNKLGNIYLSYEECSFMDIFEETLDYYSNISYNLNR